MQLYFLDIYYKLIKIVNYFMVYIYRSLYIYKIQSINKNMYMYIYVFYNK